MRSKALNYTYLYFLGTSFLILVYAVTTLLWYGDRTIMISVFGSPTPVNHFEVTILFKIAYLVLAIGYFVALRLKLPLNDKLTRLHTIVSIGVVAVNGIISLFPAKSIALEEASEWLIWAGLLVQPVFLFNIGLGITRRKTDFRFLGKK